jgi:hypothetical protein
LQQAAESGPFYGMIDWDETARGDIAALTGCFHLLTHGATQVSARTVLAILSGENVTSCTWPLEGFATVSEVDDDTTSIRAAHQPVTYSLTASDAETAATHKAAVRAAPRGHYGGTSERWAIAKRVIPLIQGEKWYTTAERHTARPAVWESLLMRDTKYRRPLRSEWTGELVAAFYQRNAVERRIIPLKRFDIPNTDGETVAIFHNLPDRIKATVDGIVIPPHMVVNKMGYADAHVANWGKRHPEWYTKRSQVRTKAEMTGDTSAIVELDKWAIRVLRQASQNGFILPADHYGLEWLPKHE